MFEFETEAYWWRVEPTENAESLVIIRDTGMGVEESFEVEADAVLPLVRALIHEYERIIK